MLEKHIGRVLAELRNAKGITQKKLGEGLEMHFSTVSAVEHGKRLELPVLQKLCDVLEVPVTDVTDMAYAAFRRDTLEMLRQTGGRMPEEPGVSLERLEDHFRQLMGGGALLADDLFLFVRQLMRNGGQWPLLGAPPASPPLPKPARRRGRPPATAKSGPRKGSPAGKKR